MKKNKPTCGECTYGVEALVAPRHKVDRVYCTWLNATMYKEWYGCDIPHTIHIMRDEIRRLRNEVLCENVACGGRGWIGKNTTCPTCNGTGKKYRS